MTLHTVGGTFATRDEILGEFFEDVAARLGWEILGQVMAWVQIMEDGPNPFYLIGSRVLGCHQSGSDLDILTLGYFAREDFRAAGIDLMKPSRTVHVEEEHVYGKMIEVTRVRDASRTLDFQLVCHTDRRKRAWECILRSKAHRAQMHEWSKLPKKERWDLHNLFFDKIEKEAFSVHFRRQQLAKEGESAAV